MTVTPSFRPDVIVEVTSVCDRQCAGCYAPNLISKEAPETLARLNPALFLSPDYLKSALCSLKAKSAEDIQSIAFRGGEPSLHPQLPALMSVARSFVDTVYLETHGRWIAFADSANAILNACEETGATIKISFDRMHGLDAATLKEITGKLTARGIRWLIAITETTMQDFQAMRELCFWATDASFLFQPKVTRAEDLMRPKHAVIHVDGHISGLLNSKSAMKSFLEVPNTPLRAARSP